MSEEEELDDLFDEEDDIEDIEDIEEIEEEETETHRGGFNFGIIILILGLIGTVGVTAIKMTSTGPTDEFMGITNPEGVYGRYFLSGMVGGIVVLLIGLVATIKMKSAPIVTEEEEWEEEMDEFEEEAEEEGICPSCGAVIPISSAVCPECGEELMPPEEEAGEEDIAEEDIDEELGLTDETIECPICGAEVPGDAGECPECGEPLGEEGAEDEEDLFSDLEDI